MFAFVFSMWKLNLQRGIELSLPSSSVSLPICIPLPSPAYSCDLPLGRTQRFLCEPQFHFKNQFHSNHTT